MPDKRSKTMKTFRELKKGDMIYILNFEGPLNPRVCAHLVDTFNASETHGKLFFNDGSKEIFVRVPESDLGKPETSNYGYERIFCDKEALREYLKSVIGYLKAKSKTYDKMIEGVDGLISIFCDV